MNEKVLSTESQSGSGRIDLTVSCFEVPLGLIGYYDGSCMTRRLQLVLDGVDFLGKCRVEDHYLKCPVYRGVLETRKN